MKALLLLLLVPGYALADLITSGTGDPYAKLDGAQLMETVYKRHQQYPYVFEQQSMIMVDAHGNTNTRKLRRYSRVEEDGLSRFLLLFDSPVDVKGVALLAEREENGTANQSFYLPARQSESGPGRAK